MEISKTSFAEDLFLLRAVLSPEECSEHIARAEAIGFEAAPITTARGFERRPEIRNNERVMLDDVELAGLLWRRVEAFVPARIGNATAVGLNERFRFYKYGAGQRFAIHRDGAFRRRNGEQSRLTFMVYLNEEFSGGETVFHATTIRPRTGMALLFDHGLLHEGSAVRRGHKYVLRTDVMYAALAAEGGGSQ